MRTLQENIKITIIFLQSEAGKQFLERNKLLGFDKKTNIRALIQKVCRNLTSKEITEIYDYLRKSHKEGREMQSLTKGTIKTAREVDVASICATRKGFNMPCTGCMYFETEHCNNKSITQKIETTKISKNTKASKERENKHQEKKHTILNRSNNEQITKIKSEISPATSNIMTDLSAAEMLLRCAEYFKKRFEEEKEGRVEAEREKTRVEKRLVTAETKVAYYDELIGKKEVVSFSELAEELGISEQKFNELLLNLKYIYWDRVGRKLKPYSNKMRLFAIKNSIKDGYLITQIVITVIGRHHFLSLFSETLKKKT